MSVQLIKCFSSGQCSILEEKKFQFNSTCGPNLSQIVEVIILTQILWLLQNYHLCIDIFNVNFSYWK